jgi:hypothetical protein
MHSRGRQQGTRQGMYAVPLPPLPPGATTAAKEQCTEIRYAGNVLLLGCDGTGAGSQGSRLPVKDRTDS